MNHRQTVREYEQAHEKVKPRGGIFRSLVAEALLSVGLLLFSFAFYQAYWTNIDSGNKQAVAGDILAQQWKNPRKMLQPELGEAFANLYIPSFGSDYAYSVIEGVSDKDLEVGPGHYEDTQMPGQVGNVAIAGHRVGTGAPFNDLGRLKTCDSIILETKDSYHVYKVAPMEAGTGADCFTPEQNDSMRGGQYKNIVGNRITTPADVSVIEEVPGQGSGVSQTKQKLLTLTTCHPQFSDRERMIVHAFEVQQIDKSTGQKPVEMV